MGGKQFSSKYQPKNRGGETKRTKLLNAMKKNGKSEEDFYSLYIQSALSQMSDGVMVGANEILDRIYRPPKQAMELVEFNLPQGEDVTPVEQAKAVLYAVSNGEIPPDVGAQLTSMIHTGLSIFEISELAKDVEEIKEAMKKED